MDYLTIDTAWGIEVGMCSSELGQFTELSRASSQSTREHAEQLSPLIESVLVAEPQAIIVGTGPGAFTGLRAGLVTAKALSRAWNIPCYGLSSLEVLALAGADRGAQEVVAMIDARRKEVFALRARPMGGDDLAVISGPQIYKPEDLAAQLRREPAVLATNFADLYADLGAREVVSASPTVMVRLVESRLARISAGQELSLDTEPQYLRRPDVHQA